MKFNQIFCKHSFQVKEAVFQYGKTIPPVASHGLTSKPGFISDATDWDASPNTIINTHFVVNGNKVMLYCRQCSKCGLVKSCDAFSYEEFKRYNDILTMEGM